VAIAVGEVAPRVEGASQDGPHVLVFFKVTCSTTQLATPVIERLAMAYPGKVAGVGQDPPRALEGFSSDYSLTLPIVPDLEPYTASDAYDITSAPTAIAVGADARVLDVAESWDREAWNRLSASVATALGVTPAMVSDADDGLPDFKPG
jgi:hypothetical protein